MSLQPKWLSGAAVALTLWICAAGNAYAQAGPFARLAGQWSGAGSIEFSDGSRERIKCRASYDVLEDLHKLGLSIRCASDSYNFELRGSATYSGGSISGVWSEVTRNVAGTLSGKGDAGGFRVIATSPQFSAGLTLSTHGDRQTVGIKSQDPQSTLKGASITMQRAG